MYIIILFNLQVVMEKFRIFWNSYKNISVFLSYFYPSNLNIG